MSLVSVIIPTKDRPDRLRRTLKTICAQSVNIEVIVCDDNSTDECKAENEAVCDTFEVRYELNPGPFGVSNARNRGASLSNGEFLSFCDDDDFWLECKLENQISLLRELGGDWVYSATAIVDENLDCLSVGYGCVSGEAFYSANRVPGGCSSVLVKKELFFQVGGFDPNFKMYADWELWLNFYAVSPPLACKSIDVIYQYHDGQMSRDFELARNEVELLFKKHKINRKKYPQSILDIDKWIAVRGANSGRFLDAALHVIKNRNSVDFAFIIFLLRIVLRGVLKNNPLRGENRLFIGEEANNATKKLKSMLEE